jgi:GDP-mannose 6-dehydrogenase
VDPVRAKLEMIRAGKSPILEVGLEELIESMVGCGRLTVTDDCSAAIAQTELSLVCVGTPSLPNGGLRTDFLERVAREIGRSLRSKGAYHSVVIRSTVLPGTTHGLILPILEKECGGKVGDSFGLSMHPEFLREGTSIRDFYDPPMTVVGTSTAEEFQRICGIYQDAEGGRIVGGERIHCQVATAEAVKYGCNILHAVKITFANEIGMFCKRAGVDSREVMSVLCKDTKLNISTRYMKPAFAFGGSCLPKDLRAYVDHGRKSDVALPMFEAVLASNRIQIERAVERVKAYGKRRIAMMGISFKEATDDLRESPLVHMAELLIGRGYDLRIFDPNVKYASLFGSNKDFIDRELPHLKSALVDGPGALEHGEVVVFGHNAQEYRDLKSKIRPDHCVIDLANVLDSRSIPCTYEGLYW